jgi:hypothetical protein
MVFPARLGFYNVPSEASPFKHSESFHPCSALVARPQGGVIVFKNSRQSGEGCETAVTGAQKLKLEDTMTVIIFGFAVLNVRYSAYGKFLEVVFLFPSNPFYKRKCKAL